jgi:hypothetical protein
MSETETETAVIRPSDEALAFTFLGGLFFTVAATVITESLLVLIGGTAITVAAVRIAVGDPDDSKS